MYFTVPPNGVAKLQFGAHFQAPGLSTRRQERSSSRLHGVSVVGDEARGVHQLSDPNLRVSSALRSAADY